MCRNVQSCSGTSVRHPGREDQVPRCCPVGLCSLRDRGSLCDRGIPRGAVRCGPIGDRGKRPSGPGRHYGTQTVACQKVVDFGSIPVLRFCSALVAADVGPEGASLHPAKGKALVRRLCGAGVPPASLYPQHLVQPGRPHHKSPQTWRQHRIPLVPGNVRPNGPRVF